MGSTVEFNVAHHNTAEGIGLYSSTLLTVNNNDASSNGEFGFKIILTVDSQFTRNSASENGDFGFLVSESDNNTLYRNVAEGSGEAGFDLGDSHDNTLHHNQAKGNAHGFNFWNESSGNTLTGNRAVGNGDTGFSLGESNGNTLTGNESVENGSHGYDLWVSAGNTLEGNLAEHNGFLGGIVLTGSSFNSLVGNQSVGSDGYGFAVWAAWDEDRGDWIRSHDNVLAGNKAVGNGSGGFVTTLAYENTFEGNHAVNNHGWAGGFWFGETEGNTVVDNVARNNRSGFQLAGSYGHELSGNSAINNTEHGFVLWESADNTLMGNTALNNGDRKSEDGGIGFDVSVGSIGNTLTGNRGHNNTICDAADWLKSANSWSGNDFRVWCESDGEVPVLTPVEWGIALDDWSPGIHSVFMIVDARPLIIDLVEDLSGRLIWDETVVDLCTIHIREVGVGYLRIGDIFQTIEGCYESDTAIQDAFDEFGLPETACVGVRVGGVDHEYCAPLS